MRLRNLFKTRVHTYPINNSLFAAQYEITSQTTWQAFWNDRRRFGWRVAVHNLRILMR